MRSYFTAASETMLCFAAVKLKKNQRFGWGQVSIQLFGGVLSAFSDSNVGFWLCFQLPPDLWNSSCLLGSSRGVGSRSPLAEMNEADAEEAEEGGVGAGRGGGAL